VNLPEGPRANIEIKARVEDLDAAAEVARRLGARDEGAEHQVDRYFRVPRGRLKLRRSSRTGDQLVLYLRPDEPGPRRADYEVIPVRAEGRARELLETILGTDVVVEKTRRLFVLDNTRIHLDEVVGLGTFLELEAVHGFGDPDATAAAHEHVGRLLRAFEIAPDDLLPHSYRELLRSRARPPAPADLLRSTPNPGRVPGSEVSSAAKEDTGA
jgi:predicted adenylyl cyclase CyaB